MQGPRQNCRDRCKNVAMQKNQFLKSVDKSWTLFLDRDGVINQENVGDYVTHWGEFRFYEGVQEAIRKFTSIFKRIIIVTNQRGVSKGLMNEGDLRDIHLNMLGAIEAHGGKIDRIYYCTDLNEDSVNRKPNPGMGKKAKEDFPEIDFSKTIMVGNTMADMQFGRNLGAFTIFVTTNRPAPDASDPWVDAIYPSLIAVANDLEVIARKN